MSTTPPGLDAGAAITRITAIVGERVLAARTESGLSAPQLQVLRLAEGGASMSALVAGLDAPKSSITSVVDQLESLRLVVRSTDEGDRRRQLVTSTPRGLSRLRAFDASLTARIDVLLAGLPARRAARLRTLLSRFPDARTPVPLAGPR